MKTVRVILSPDADETLKELSIAARRRKQENTRVKGFYKKIDIIKYNVHYGDQVAKSLIPVEYKIKYNANNLFRVEIPGFWRFTYTLKNGITEDETVVLILDIMSHETYNKKFGYRGK
ncbi:MAG: hypothetical protein KGI27_12660 [Thaumarchaeota archaeon]|nr:hypothetical protein [Nitrososphaerota archaeon]